jgi:hypothetical protein
MAQDSDPHTLSDSIATRRQDPGTIATLIDLIAATPDARVVLGQRLEDAFDAELLELAMDGIKKRVKPKT